MGVQFCSLCKKKLYIYIYHFLPFLLLKIFHPCCSLWSKRKNDTQKKFLIFFFFPLGFNCSIAYNFFFLNHQFILDTS